MQTIAQYIPLNMQMIRMYPIKCANEYNVSH